MTDKVTSFLSKILVAGIATLSLSRLKESSTLLQLVVSVQVFRMRYHPHISTLTAKSHSQFFQKLGNHRCLGSRPKFTAQ